MAVRIFPLRGVPHDEAEGVRQALTRANIDFYETPPSTAGTGDSFLESETEAIWVSQDADAPSALGLIHRYRMQPDAINAPTSPVVAPAPFRRTSSTPRVMLVLIGIVLVLLILGAILGTW